MEKYLKRLCNAILDGRFKAEKYCSRKSYYGVEIQTQHLFASYGKIGYSVTVYSEEQYDIEYDYELNDLTINGKPYQYEINLLYLGNNDINTVSEEPVWENFQNSVELECYTDAGGDMLIDLEEPTKEKLQEYIDNFDIDREVMLWWHDGEPGNGVPFNSIKEHYNDYEDYLKWLQKICDKMPY